MLVEFLAARQDGRMMRVLIIGATSAIAEATARLFAERHAALYLVGRDAQRLAVIAADLMFRGAMQCDYEILDLNDFAGHETMLARAAGVLGKMDVVLIAHGTLDDQAACEASVERTLQAISTNGVSVVALCTRIAHRLAAQHSGTIAVISSVAGERGRASNYVYGSAKALVNTYLSGLRQRMYHAGVHVLTVKPGFVDTPMTAQFAKGPLWASRERVATGLLRAIDRKTDVAYLPNFWRTIMMVIRAIPEGIFKRLTL